MPRWPSKMNYDSKFLKSPARFKMEFENLRKKIEELEAKNIKLEKENQSIKTQLGTMQSDFKKLNSKVTSSTNHPTQSHSKEKCVGCSPNPSSDPDQKEPTPAKSPREQSKPSLVLDTDHLWPTETTVLAFPDQDVEYSVPVKNKFDALSVLDLTSDLLSDQAKTKEATTSESKIPVIISRDNFSKQRSEKATPTEILDSISIPQKATMLLIGDSVIRNVNPARLAPRGEHMFKVCVPGMTLNELYSWICSANENPHIKRIIIHAGINSCPAGAVSIEQWLDLINRCMKAFPHAYIVMNSVIPARGRHHMNNAIFPSNRNLHAACQRLKVICIDHTDTFTTESGAPRLSLYANLTHPTSKGTARLANNLRSALIDRERNLNRNGPNTTFRPFSQHHYEEGMRRDHTDRFQTFHSSNSHSGLLQGDEGDGFRGSWPLSRDTTSYSSITPQRHVLNQQINDSRHFRRSQQAFPSPTDRTSVPEGNLPYTTYSQAVQNNSESCPPPTSVCHFPPLSLGANNSMHKSLNHPGSMPYYQPLPHEPHNPISYTQSFPIDSAIPGYIHPQALRLLSMASQYMMPANQRMHQTPV